jgi:hypothetical protein
MARITVGIDLPASPEKVWDIVEPIERHVDWMADAVAIRFEGSQTRGVGTKFLCDTKVGPITLTDKMEITEWSPRQAMGVRHLSMAVDPPDSNGLRTCAFRGGSAVGSAKSSAASW